MLLHGTFDTVYNAPLVLGYVYNRTHVAVYESEGPPRVHDIC